MLEKNLQKQITSKLKSAGFFVRKISAENSKGLPDLLIIGHGEILFVEVKTLTGRLTKLQSYVIGVMQDAGAKVEVWNSVGHCERFIRATTGSD